jgi:hypothetical protein
MQGGAAQQLVRRQSMSICHIGLSSRYSGCLHPVDWFSAAQAYYEFPVKALYKDTR